MLDFTSLHALIRIPLSILLATPYIISSGDETLINTSSHFEKLEEQKEGIYFMQRCYDRIDRLPTSEQQQLLQTCRVVFDDE
jgi:hypothetical protein